MDHIASSSHSKAVDPSCCQKSGCQKRGCQTRVEVLGMAQRNKDWARWGWKKIVAIMCVCGMVYK